MGWHTATSPLLEGVYDSAALPRTPSTGGVTDSRWWGCLIVGFAPVVTYVRDTILAVGGGVVSIIVQIPIFPLFRALRSLRAHLFSGPI